MELTSHAVKRCRQRALPNEVIDLVMQLGSEFDAGGGCKIKALCSKFAKKEFLQELGYHGVMKREKWCDVYLIIDSFGGVRTVGYRFKRIKKDFH